MTLNRQGWLATWLLLSIVAWATESAGSSAPGDGASGKFVRLQRGAKDVPLALQTAIVRFAPPAGDGRRYAVDLVAAIHIADADYFRQLNREFDQYDVVLYELVAPEESKKPPRDAKPGNHPVALLQVGMKDLLNLEYQLQGIDYTRKNMVHADMTPDEFSRSMRARGESMAGTIFRMMGYAMGRQDQAASNAKLLAALFDKNRATALKRAVAEQLELSEDAMSALEGPKGSTLIGERNKTALDALRKEIDAGKQKIAIFYGAGHMPDFQKRLRDEFGLVPVETRWLTAWNLEERKP